MEGQSTGQAYAREVEEATRKLDEALSQWQSETKPSQLSQFPLRTLTWLAVAPVWPRDLAEKGFPLDGQTLATGAEVAKLLTEIAGALFCDSGSSDCGGGELFWMNAMQQSALLSHLQTLPDEESQSLGVRGYIRARLKEASAAMVGAAANSGSTLSPPLQRWVELAQNAGDDESITRLLRGKVEGALWDAKNHGQIISPEALRWIEAAKPFVGWLGTPMEWALAQGGRRLELFYREAYDGRSLKNYFIRDYQEQAFKDLLEGADPTTINDTGNDPNPFWALHYVGLGGTGKTMLMRRISSQLAGEMGLAVARIDFDRLNPDYPSRAPGLLLMGFAEELRLRATEIAPDIFERFDKEVETLHETIKEGYESNVAVSVPVDALVDDPGFQRVLRPFIEAVRRLSSQKRVVLVLDTCEELAKMRSDGSLPESVRVTFDILQRIQSKVKSLRVVFSGRRPLASAGHMMGREGSTTKYKWTCPVSKLPERDYLRLYEIRGFTRDESLDFLKQYGGNDGSRVNPALFDAILEQSCSADKSFDSRFEWHDGRIETDTDPRYNPYDLDMFAEWAANDPKVGEKEIKEGATAYVKDRIIKRADHKIRRLLPEIVLLGRFDEKMIRQLVETQGAAFDTFFTELISQEWLDVDRNATQTGTVWAMDSIMRKRLLKYYQTEDLATFSKATKRIAEFMSRLTLERDWEELSTAFFETALSALLHNKTKAAQWWDEVDKKLAESANWAWARNLTDQLLEDDGLAARADATLGDEVEKECVLRPAIRATQAAALTHLLFTSPEVNRGGLLGIWAEILEKAERHPTREGAQRLRYRAIAGQAAAYRWQYDRHSPQLLDTMVELFELLPRTSEFKNESSAASEIAMLEALVEICESLALEYGLPEDPQFTGKLSSIYFKYYQQQPIWWSDSLPKDVQAFYLTLVGRLRKLCAVPEVEHPFYRALDLLDGPDSGKSAQRYLDWHRPEDFAARILLEFVRTLYPAYAVPEDILRQVERYKPMTGNSAPDSDTIDSDRLRSATLLIEAYSRLERSRDADHSDDSAINYSVLKQVSAPDCNAHRTFPALFATALEIRFAAWRVERAVEQGQEISKKAENNQPPILHVQKAADRSLMRMAARLHLRDERRFTIGGSLSESNLLSDLSLRFYLNALDGAKSNEKIEPYLQRESDERRRATITHIGWRSGKIDRTKLPANSSRNDSSVSFAKVALALDAVESIYLSASSAKDTEDLSQKGRGMFETLMLTRQWAKDHPTQPIEALTLCLRAAALDRDTFISNMLNARINQELLDGLIRKVGKRRAADIAFEEGSLLALKLPKRGLKLLRMAYDWYDQTDDSLNQFVSIVSIAMLYAGLQDEIGLRESIEVMNHGYRRVEANTRLPTWEVLAQAANEREDLFRVLANLDSANNWRPILVRVLGCLIRQQEFSTSGNMSKALRVWIEENYATTVHDRSYPPPDLSYLLTYQDTPVVPLEPESVLAASSRKSTTALKTIFLVLFGLAIVGAVITAVTYGVQWVFSFFLPISRGWSFLGAILLLILVLRISAIWRWYASISVATLQRTFSVESYGQIKDVNHPLLSALKMRMQIGFFSKDFSLGVTSSVDDSYRRLAQATPERARRAWSRVNGYAGKRYLTTKINVNEENAAAPWEAILGLPSEKIVTFEQNRLICRRILKVRGTARLSPLTLPLKVITLASNVSQADLAQQSWRSASAASGVERTVLHSVEKVSGYFSGAQEKRRVASDVQVLHLFGTPRQTSSGLRLELSGADGVYDIAPATGSIRVPERKGSVSKGGRGRSYLAQAEEITGSFPALKICLVQMESFMDESRDSGNRDEAGLLRRFGAELFKCGIPAIVLLPPLPEHLAVETITVLRELLTREVTRGRRRWWQKRTPLPRTVRTMQEIIGRSYSDHETAIEVAFDLCLYMVDEFDLDVRPASPAD